MTTNYYERIVEMLRQRPMTTHEIVKALFPAVECSRRISQLKGATSDRLKRWVDTGYIRRVEIDRRNAELNQAKEWLYSMEASR